MANQFSTLVDSVMWLRKKLNGTHCGRRGNGRRKERGYPWHV